MVRRLWLVLGDKVQVVSTKMAQNQGDLPVVFTIITSIRVRGQGDEYRGRLRR